MGFRLCAVFRCTYAEKSCTSIFHGILNRSRVDILTQYPDIFVNKKSFRRIDLHETWYFLYKIELLLQTVDSNAF